MQPTFQKYGLKKNAEGAGSLPRDQRHYANAGKVSSCNVSESGGGEIRSISKGDRSNSNSPFRHEARYTLDPKELKPVFCTIQEVWLKLVHHLGNQRKGQRK